MVDPELTGYCPPKLFLLEARSISENQESNFTFFHDVLIVSRELSTPQGRSQEFFQGEGLNISLFKGVGGFAFAGASKNPIKTVDFTSPRGGGGLSPQSPPLSKPPPPQHNLIVFNINGDNWAA